MITPTSRRKSLNLRSTLNLSLLRFYFTAVPLNRHVATNILSFVTAKLLMKFKWREYVESGSCRKTSSFAKIKDESILQKVSATVRQTMLRNNITNQ
jgi:hypothetical protein